jgi:hypothetical protein
MANAPDGTSLESRWVGRVIDDRYKIVEVLGEGGMGAVFVAEHLRLRKPVAFKTIKAEFAAHSQAEARFQREALATGRLDHPHVASAIDFGPLPEGGFYLVTQMVRGESLSKRLAAGPMPWPQVCLLGMQIADALAAAHAIGIIHRDLKPDNILLEQRRDGALHARVVDFGIARVSGEQATIADVAQPLTRMGSIIGTPGYMPPEQGTGQQVDLRADLYALGVIMWECLTGRTLWSGATISDLFTAQLASPAPPVSKEIADIPPEFAALIEMLLDRNPKRRPESARHVREALRRLTHGTLVVGTTAPVIVRPAATPKWLVPALAGFGLIILIAVYVALTSGDATAPPAATPDGKPVAGEPAPKTSPTPGDAKAAAAQTIPDALAAHVDTLLTSGDKKARKKSADAIAAHEPAADVPSFARNIAAIERNASCEGKRAAVQKIAEDEDARALPALLLLSNTPRKGCGTLDREDCLECLREPLARTIGQLEK